MAISIRPDPELDPQLEEKMLQCIWLIENGGRWKYCISIKSKIDNITAI